MIELAMSALMAFAGAAQTFGAPLPDGPGEPAKSVVLVIGPGETDGHRMVIEAVQSQLVDLNVAFIVHEAREFPRLLPEQIAAAHDTAAQFNSVSVFWCDFSSDSRVYLFLSGRDGGRILVRKLARARGRSRAEAVAIIVRSATDAVLSGGEVGTDVVEALQRRTGDSQAPPRPSVQPQTGTEVEKKARRGHLGAVRLAYMLVAHAMDHPVVQGLALGADIRLYGDLSLTGGTAILDALEKEGDAATLRVRRHPVYLGMKLAFPISDRISTALLTSFTVDYVTQQVTDLAEAALPNSDDDDVVYSIAPALEALFKVIDRVHVSVLLGGFVPINDRRYLVDRPDGDEVLVEPRKVQPFIHVGLWTEVF